MERLLCAENWGCAEQNVVSAEQNVVCAEQIHVKRLFLSVQHNEMSE